MIPKYLQRRAWITLALVSWVVVLCVSVNAHLGGATSCAYSQTVDHDTDDGCDLVDHLLVKAAVFNFVALPILLFAVLTVMTVVGRCSDLVHFTEPISSPYRRHLTLCVFRE
ncbi:hypothetical protein [Thaumasiovibrio subtropicus]|uniref:hypothetical protein n=1 Tax=Thaumasiovibrio subtropicus TaxID=1891207 RepID=UPI00131C3BD9|nr:hypothetical protein [Thaumasiovibrio subtropicus]